MKDFYLNEKNVIDRLLADYEKHKSLIIAYDFDNTVYDYHNEGHTCYSVIYLLERCERLGFKLVVFTAAEDDRIPEIKKYLKENGIPYHAINENVIPEFKNSKKIYYNVLLDDRAGLASAYYTLSKVVDEIEINNYVKRKGANKYETISTSKPIV